MNKATQRGCRECGPHRVKRTCSPKVEKIKTLENNKVKSSNP